ncbi:MAG TPA: LD-carboxypeptidase [Pyrinomonadaceae bacterium]|nr:LD-carboxypeptidase [Pyrinomonadaceae bacterium]
MKRRDLLKGAVVLPFLAQTMLSKESSKPKLIKPKRLSKGDTVGIIAPSSGISDAEFEKALKNMADLGFKTKVGKYVKAVNGFIAGTDKERLEDLHWAFEDQEIKAVWCIRGGYGATRFLPDINYNLIKKNPKILIGYSDITALHTAIHQNTGLITFHGPVATSNYTDYPKNHVLNILTNPSAPYKVELSPINVAKEAVEYKTQVITKGKAKGRLIGGNLSLLTAMAGTPFGLKNTKGKILFTEDVGEKPYRIDRMFVQLKQSINLRELAGIALGVFTECDPPDDKSQTVLDVAKDHLSNLGIPVIYGLSFGHIREQFTLPVGVEAELDTENATMTFLESGVV